MTDRRRFLQWTLAGAAGGLATRARAEEVRGGCGLAIGTYGLPSMRLEEAIRLIAATGYNAVEIAAMPDMTGAPARLATEDRAKIRDRIAESGLRLCALMAHLQPQRVEADHKAQLAELYHLIRLGHQLSPERPPVIQTVLGGKTWGESKDFFRDRLADWIQVAADLKGILSIKPHRNHAMTTPAEAIWLIEQLGKPDRLGMTFDYSHYAFQNPPLPLESTVAGALAVTNYVAVKDAVEEGGAVRFALAGEGRAWDQAEIVAAFHDGGYRGDFCCEVSSQLWKSPGYDPVGATKTCFVNMSEAFARAGVARK